MRITSQDGNRVVVSLISRGELWGHYFNKLKAARKRFNAATAIICLNQLKFLDENRVNYYRKKGLI